MITMSRSMCMPKMKQRAKPMYSSLSDYEMKPGESSITQTTVVFMNTSSLKATIRLCPPF